MPSRPARIGPASSTTVRRRPEPRHASDRRWVRRWTMPRLNWLPRTAGSIPSRCRVIQSGCGSARAGPSSSGVSVATPRSSAANRRLVDRRNLPKASTVGSPQIFRILLMCLRLRRQQEIGQHQCAGLGIGIVGNATKWVLPSVPLENTKERTVSGNSPVAMALDASDGLKAKMMSTSPSPATASSRDSFADRPCRRAKAMGGVGRDTRTPAPPPVRTTPRRPAFAGRCDRRSALRQAASKTTSR